MVVLRVGGDLTLETAAPFCAAVGAALRAGGAVLDLRGVGACDVVGLAAVVQATARAAVAGVPLGVRPGRALAAVLLRARLVDALPLPMAVPPPDAPIDDVALGAGAGGPVAAGARVSLRALAARDLARFARWADDGLLDQLGSALLYCCRHLGPGHPAFVEHAVGDPTALVLAVDAGGGDAVGFARLHTIDLPQRFALLEVAIAGVPALRRGLGADAARLATRVAVDVLDLARVECAVCAHDVVGAEALVAAGFSPEGRLRGARVYAGRRRDLLLFSILRDEVRRRPDEGACRLWPATERPSVAAPSG